MAEHEKHLMQRRDFLRVAAGSGLAITTGGLLTSLSGCGGGSGGALSGGALSAGSSTGAGELTVPDASRALTASAIATRTVAGSVNTAQIGGTGLRVQSAYKGDAVVGTDGKFTTLASTTGQQLLAVTDAQHNVRALALTNPRVAGTLAVDATSTALGLVMMTPGILETDPARAAQRVAEIKTYPSFATLVTFLAQALKISSLTAARHSPVLDRLKGAVINQYRSLHGGQLGLIGLADVAGTASRLEPRVLDGRARFKAEFQTGVNDARPVLLSNSAWRMVRVDRELLDSKGRRLRLVQPIVNTRGRYLDTLNPASGVSWSSLLQQTVGAPTTETETVDLLETIPPVGTSTPSRITTVRYWVSGPGVGLGSEKPNFSINYANAVGQSVLFTLVLPFVDLVIGGKLFGKVAESVDGLWTNIQSAFAGGNFIQALTAGMTANDAPAAFAAALDLTLAIFGVIGVALGTLPSLGLTASVLVLLAQAVAFTSVAFSAVNVGWTVGSWLKLPAIVKLDLPVSGGTVIVR